MAEVIQGTHAQAQRAQHDFWRPPSENTTHQVGSLPQQLEEACDRCGTEFIVGSRFCHNCGATRPESSDAIRFRPGTNLFRLAQMGKRFGLSSGAFIAFLLGIVCVIGAAAVGFVFSARTLLDWQAVQVWRIELLLGAVAAFVAGCLFRPAR
jgi:hypothetical protein